MSCQAPDGSENRSSCTVQRLHRNLGHPKPEALVELLQSRAASDQAKSLRQLAISNALHASATSDQTRWQLLHCDIKLMKLVNACRPMCCGSNATAVPRSFPASVSLTRPQSMSPYQATPIASAKPGAELLVPVVCFGP